MLRKLFAPLALGIAGIALTAAAVHADLPAAYWSHPAATEGASPHDWQAIERDLSPEACAQCHAAQFADWKASMHARAFSPGLIGQFPQQDLSDNNDCLKCHAPLAEQKYKDMKQLTASLKLKLQQQQGFNSDAELRNSHLPLRHAGVTCAACHVRGWQRFGPPQRNTGRSGKIDGPAHGGFTGSKEFEQSQFCASCHQFPEEYAINGKPLENTMEEWKQSRFASEGVHCQSCHMPDRKHLFKGIHDPATVREGLDIASGIDHGTASLSIASIRIGHAFPTYVTPKVTVSIEALDAQGNVLKQKEWEIGRHVAYDNGWQEISDTRMLPGEKRSYELAALPSQARSVRFRVDVIPDNFYKGLYRDLLDEGLQGDAGRLILLAQDGAEQNDYQLYEHEEPFDGFEHYRKH
ncbi:MAG: hypothetical protein COS82_00240 [Zetaproteobacteria bacterium CG06_land_8_20_14_3_00_59_53]|nr:MAG: hypothetical protein AUK36_04985 [Zetaproteobacteria bacterium CG2_30_59_37]PIO90423.1 MAG: hypothetical protein COX56_01300 [Zetaproteobacteria bacterium CG23_combo_of_CG06-09_8_20_14_all_59_86]PIU71374.1 MAG: hypothetical protein COS82_00240 [Zetaproteobacteria bacterium CG06_land_8_20_14_3_00_59_53]HCS13955.1 hypothetical protein [Zetaproteobacteria bacterium]